MAADELPRVLERERSYSTTMSFPISRTKTGERTQQQRVRSRKLRGRSSRWHRCLWEVLEDRRLLTGDINFGNLATALHDKLHLVESNVVAALNYAPAMPIVGDQLGSIAQVINTIGDGLAGTFGTLMVASSDSSTSQTVHDAILNYINGFDGGATATNVIVQPNIDAGGTWEFNILLHQAPVVSSFHPHFDVALGNYLKFSAATEADRITLLVGMDYRLKFTFDPAGNFALADADLPAPQTKELAFTVTAAPGNIQRSGTLASLLHVTATVQAGTTFSGTFAVDVAPSANVAASFVSTNGQASHVNLGLMLNFGAVDLPFNPKFNANFQFDWKQQNSVVLVSGMNVSQLGALSNANFASITLVGSSLFGSDGFVSNIVQKVQAFTKPIQPLIDFISFQVPGLSDLGLEISVKKFLEDNNPGSAAAIEATINAIDTINHIDLSGLAGDFPLGSLELTNLDTLRQNTTWSGLPNLTTHTLPGQFGPLDFPMITNATPATSAIQLLLGGDATLFSFSTGFSALFNLPEIPLFGIPPFLGFFLRPKAAFSISFGFGYDTAGLHAAVNDTNTSHFRNHVLDGFYIDNTKTHVSDDNGNEYDHYATSVDIIGGLDLVARAVILEVSGGLAAQVNLHVDPNLNSAGERVRLSALDQAIEQGQIPFAASGSIFVTADIAVVIPTFWGNIVLAHVNLGHLTIVDFGADGSPTPADDGNTIFVQKTDANEKIFVRMTTLSTPTADDPKAFTKAILVEYPDHKDIFPAAKYTHDENGVLRPPEHIRDYNLIATKQAYHFVSVGGVPHYVPYDETGDQTIVVEDLTWDGQIVPVNSVLIGGTGNDTLEYQGAGKAILIGAGGDDILQSTNLNAASVAAFADRIAANQTGYYETGWPAEVQNRIDAQIEANGQPPIVHVQGGHGDFMSGAGPHVVLAGGSGKNLLDAGTSAIFLGGSGPNQYKVSLKLSTGSLLQGHIIVGQSAHNAVIFERTDVPNNNDDSIVLRAIGNNLHVTGKQTDIVVDHTDTVSFTLNGGTLDIGDLNALGTVQLLANLLPSRTTVTHVLMDTPQTPQPFPMIVSEHTFLQLDSDGNPVLDEHGNFAPYYDLNVLQGGSGNQAGANLEMVGLAPSDDLQLKLHGGAVSVLNLDGTGIGRVAIDGTARAANSTFVDDIQIQLHNGNDFMFPDVNGTTTVRMADAAPPYRVQILGSRVQDITRFTQIIMTGGGTNPVAGKLFTIDASQLIGELQVDSFENVLLNAVNPQLDVSIEGNSNFPMSGQATHVTVGDGRLALIRSIVQISKAELTIDNKDAQGEPDNFNPNPGRNKLVLTDTTFTGWQSPFSVVHTPTLTYDNLQGPLTVFMGQNDEISLDGTPPGITRIAINSNWFGNRDAVYTSNWSVPIDISGNFGIYLGRRLNPLTGVVERVEHLGGVAIPLTYYPLGSPTVEVVLDGDLDPAGVSYIFDGDTNLHLVNQTVGLSVTISGFRLQDELHLLMPGGSVQADLTHTGPGTIFVEGGARLAGTNPAATNNIIVNSRGGNITLDPTGTGNSVMHAFNTINVVASLPQDNLTLNVPTQTSVANTVTADASQLRGMLHVNVVNPLAGVLSPFGLTSIILAAVNPLLAVFIVGTDPFPGSATYQTAQTTVNFGHSQLARIEGDVTVSKAVLSIDNSAATSASVLRLTGTQFQGWVAPDTGLKPTLHYDHLYKDLTLTGGAGDRIELDHSPASIDRIIANNSTTAQDEIYSTQWTVPIIANGNWSMYLGSNLHPDGIVERIKQLVGLAIPVTLNFSGSPTGHVVFDGDSDPAAAQYVIDGNGRLHIVNQTVGLNVTINGFRSQDQVYVYLPGGSVTADLTHTGTGILYLDGKSRLAGNHPTAPNNISARVRAGNISLDPVNTNDSVMHAFNTVYVQGSMPQDSLNVTASTSFAVAPSQQGLPRTSVGVYTGYFGSYNVVNQPSDFYTVLSWPFQSIVNTDSNDPAILVSNPPPPGVNYVDTTLLYRYSGPDPQGLPDAFVPVRIYPLASSPSTIDSNANFDASQLRGSFSFQVAQPDYTAAEALVAGFGYRSALPVETFGQTTVVLSKVNPQLSVSITGTAPINSSDYNSLNPFISFGGGSVIHYAGTQVTIGTAVLSDIQGDVAVHQGWLKDVNDRQGANANILTMTGSMLTGWATSGGITHPTLTFDTLQGDFTVSGSPVDQFDVENTPASAPKTRIQNFATSGSPATVYVMNKTVMPLYVTGNFALYAGRRLNPDGSVTAVGQIGGLFNPLAKFDPYGAGLNSGISPSFLLENLQIFDPSNTVVVPGVPYSNYIYDYTIQTPLPVFFNYTGAGQGTLVFDAAHQVINNPNALTNSNLDGIASNINYPGKADLRYRTIFDTRGAAVTGALAGDVIYGASTEVFYYGPIENGNTTFLNKPGPIVVIDNPFAAPVHYISNPNSSGGIEEIIVGAALGPVDLQGHGAGTRVEINPLFSLPIQQVATNGVVPGWTAAGGGFSLVDTIHADVTVGNATLRVIGDIPLPAGVQPPASLPDVHVTAGQITGIADATIRFSDLADSPSINSFSGSFGLTLDINALQLPGLSIELPSHAAAKTFVDNTPAGITTAISTILSASDTTFTAGPISVLKTTGPLVLGQLFGSILFNWPVASGQPVGGMQWSDGLSVSQVIIGSPVTLAGDFNGDHQLNGADVRAMLSALSDLNSYQTTRGLSDAALLAVADLNGDGRSTNADIQSLLDRLANADSSIDSRQSGSVQNIQGAVFLAGDSHANSPLVISIDGSADSARTAVNFTARSYSQSPGGILTTTNNAGADSFFEELVGFAPATIYFSTDFHRARNLNVYGSASSLYNVAAAPPTMHLFAGAGSTVRDQSAPIDIVGAWTVQLALASYSPIPGLNGPPQIVVEKDPLHPHLIDLSLNQTAIGDFPSTPPGTLRLDSAGSGLLDLSLNSDSTVYWQVLYAGADAHLTVNYGPLVISDTGAAGTVVNGGLREIDVNGTTGPLQINPGGQGGPSPVSELVQLGQSGNMQALQGEVDILSNDPTKAFMNVVLRNTTDSGSRTIHLLKDVDGNIRITGMAPGLVKLIGDRFSPSLYGGAGGSTFQLDSELFPQTLAGFNFYGGSSGDVLAAANLPNMWQIYGTSYLLLNNNVSQGIGNLRGGFASDTFNFSGATSGNLDGGPGIDTLAYSSSSLWHGMPFDLTHGIAPLVGGLASNLEIVPIEITNPGDQTRRAGAPINPQSFPILGGLGSFTYAATGLPTGLLINSQTGQVTGTIPEAAVSGSPYTVQVSATDGFNSAAASLRWTVQPGVLVTNPGSQSNSVTNTVNLPTQANSVYGLSLTFSASGLPAGLTINQQTGLISGSIAIGADSASPYQVTVQATDGAHTGSTSFQWNVLPSFSLVNPGNITTPEGVPIKFPIQVVNPSNVPLTFSASGLPSYLSINSSTGVIAGSIYFYHQTYGYDPAFPVIVNASDGSHIVSAGFYWSTKPGFTVYDLADQFSRTGDEVSLNAGLAQNPYNHTFSYTVSGLPPGLNFNPISHSISGTIDINGDGSSPYHTVIAIVDQTISYTYHIDFHWIVAPTIVLANPGNQSSTVGTAVDLAIPVLREFGSPVVFSADNLPIGLSVEATTGHIHGTIQAQTSVPNSFQIFIHANDGPHTADISFLWTVTSAAANVVQLADPIHGGVVTVASPAGTTLTASLSYPSYYESANSVDFPLGQLQFEIDGAAPGGSTQLTITPPVGHNWSDYYVYGTTPLDPSSRWYDFLYQHPTDADDASTTGAVFLPNGQIVLHLVDGGRGDSDAAVNGTILQSFGGGPAVHLLSAHITGSSATWPLGAPLTLGSQIGGSAAPGALIDWQVFTYTPAFDYIQIAHGNQALLGVTLPPSALSEYYVFLKVTSQDGLASVTDSYTVHAGQDAPANPTPVLARFQVAGIPTDISTGQPLSGDILAEDADGSFIAAFSGPISVQIADAHGNPIANISGNFANGHFTILSQALTNGNPNPETDTLTITSGAVSMQLPIVVHPVTYFAAALHDPIIASIGRPFDFMVQAQDDRGIFNAGYTGSAHLTYTDAGGVHELGGGYHTAASGVVTFASVVLPALGTYTLQAASADDMVIGNFIVTVPLVTHFSISGPGSIRQDTPFDITVVARDADEHSVVGYTGLLAPAINGSAYLPEAITAGDQGEHVFHNLEAFTPGLRTLTVSDGIVTSSFTLQVLAPPSRGDIDQDGKLTVADISRLLQALTDLYAYKTAHMLSDSEVTTIGDVDGDGHVTNRDIQALIVLVNSSSGDGDGSSAIQSAIHSKAAPPTMNYGIGNQPVTSISSAVPELPRDIAVPVAVVMPTMIGKKMSRESVVTASGVLQLTTAVTDSNNASLADRDEMARWGNRDRVALTALAGFSLPGIGSYGTSFSVLANDSRSSNVPMRISIGALDDFYSELKQEQSIACSDDLALNAYDSEDLGLSHHSRNEVVDDFIEPYYFDARISPNVRLR
jgi:hypothetical protein